jgi:hypothetical protein
MPLLLANIRYILEPRFETNIRVLEDGPDQHREFITAFLDALRALPVEGAGINGMNSFIIASAGNGRLLASGARLGTAYKRHRSGTVFQTARPSFAA